MKKIAIFIFLFIVLFSFNACDKKQIHNEQETTIQNVLDVEEITTELKDNSTTTTKNSNSSTIKETIENHTKKPNKVETTSSTVENNNKQVTYYSDNPNNKYIVAVSEKFNVKKENLIALIRRNSSNDGATIIEFKGNRDDEGNLIISYSEVKYVYDMIDKTGEIRRASGTHSGNVGYSYLESLAIFKLTEKYIVPNISDIKEKMPYNE